MPVSKRRLRWILLIIFMVFPLTLITGFVWFVASDTWLQRELDAISKTLGFELHCDDLRVAGARLYQYDGLELNGADGQQLLQAPRMLIAQERLAEQNVHKIQIDQAAFTLQPDSLLHFVHLLGVYAKAKDLYLLDIKSFTCAGLQGSLSIQDQAQLHVQAAGVLNQEQLSTLALLFQAGPYVERLPAFIFADQLQVKAFSAQLDIFNLVLTWRCELQWPQGMAQLHYDGQVCTVEFFKDERVPLCTIAEQGVQIALGPLHFNRMQLQFDAEQQVLLAEAIGSNKPWRMQMDASPEMLRCRLLEAEWPHELTALADYMPQWLRATWPQQWSLKGSCWNWQDQGPANGQLQLQAPHYFLRSTWQFDEALLIENALLKTPEMSWQCKQLHFSDQAVHVQAATPLHIPPAYAPLWQLFGLKDFDVMTAGDAVLVVQEQNALRIEQDGTVQGQAAQVDAKTVNQLGSRSLFTAGTLQPFSVIQSQTELRMKAQIQEAQCGWPLADVRLRDVEWNYRRNQQQERWQLQTANIVLVNDVPRQEEHGQWRVHLLQWQWNPHAGILAEIMRLVHGE